MKNKLNFILALASVAAGLAGCAAEKSGQSAMQTKAPAAEAAAALPAAITNAPLPLPGAGWQSLFDGKTLAGWQVTDFAGHGAVDCESNCIVIEMGSALSGVNFTNPMPRMNYEVALEAIKLEGSDFFCGLTFPVGETNCSLILGGWGGTVVGISSIDGADASENETTQYVKFETGKWHGVRVRVTGEKIEAWLDGEKIVDLKTAGRKIGLRFGEIEMSTPLGICAYETRAAVREIKVRKLP